MSLNIKTDTGRQVLASLGGNVINGAEMQHYLTEERIIGYWTDGKPLYRKMVHVPLHHTTTTGLQTYTHSTGLSASGHTVVYWTAANLILFNTANHYQVINTVYSDTSANLWQIQVRFDNYSPAGDYDKDVIIFYTKTADTPITNNNTYSTDEVLTGKTWIDGKPIYRKVLQSYTKDDSGVKFIPIDAYLDFGWIVTCSVNDGAGAYMESFIDNQSKQSRLRAYICNNNHLEYPNCIAVQTDLEGWQNMPVTIIVEYTKTTN